MVATLEKNTLLNSLPAWNDCALMTVISNTIRELEARFKPYKFRESFDGFPLVLSSIDILAPCMYDGKQLLANIGCIAVFDSKTVLLWKGEDFETPDFSSSIALFESKIQVVVAV